MKYGLLALNSAVLFFLFYYLWETFTAPKSRLGFSDIGSLIDRQVMGVMRRHTRTRGIAAMLEKMLRATTFRPGGEPPTVLHFTAVTGACFLAVLASAAVLLNNPVAGLLLAMVAATAPYQLLQFDYRRNSKKLKKQVPQFLLAVDNLFGTYGDPVTALENLRSRLKHPLKREITWFVDNIKFGVTADVCVNTVKSRLPDRVLKDFFDDLLFYMKHGGDFHSAIGELVKRTFDREIAAVERNTATSSAVAVFFVLVGVYFFMLFTLSATQPDIMRFLVDSFTGKCVVVAMIVIFIIASYFTRVMVSLEEEKE